MGEYRAFVIDKGDHIVRRHDFEAEDDVQAILVAEKFLDGHDVEVWHLRRVVGRLSAKTDLGCAPLARDPSSPV